jgi:hypothetical protein
MYIFSDMGVQNGMLNTEYKVPMSKSIWMTKA